MRGFIYRIFCKQVLSIHTTGTLNFVGYIQIAVSAVRKEAEISAMFVRIRSKLHVGNGKRIKNISD